MNEGEEFMRLLVGEVIEITCVEEEEEVELEEEAGGSLLGYMHNTPRKKIHTSQNSLPQCTQLLNSLPQCAQLLNFPPPPLSVPTIELLPQCAQLLNSLPQLAQLLNSLPHVPSY